MLRLSRTSCQDLTWTATASWLKGYSSLLHHTGPLSPWGMIMIWWFFMVILVGCFQEWRRKDISLQLAWRIDKSGWGKWSLQPDMAMCSEFWEPDWTLGSAQAPWPSLLGSALRTRPCVKTEADNIIDHNTKTTYFIATLPEETLSRTWSIVQLTVSRHVIILTDFCN